MILAPLWVNVIAIVASVAHFHRENYFLEENEHSKIAGWIFTITLLGGIFGLFAYLAWYWVIAVSFVCAAAGGVFSTFLSPVFKFARWVGPVVLFGAWATEYAQM